MSRVIALVLCVVICLFAASCSNNSNQENLAPTNETTTTASVLTTAESVSERKNIALYFSYSDSLDPYKATTAGNRAVCSLLFDSLVKLDNNLNANSLLASSVSMSGKTISIVLNSHKFSDGSYVTGEDVVYSIERCKNSSNSDYAGALENFQSYSASGSQVFITLKRYDRNAKNLLDFPIMKKGSADKKNEDGKQVAPIGSGRYVFVDNKGEFSLTGNQHYFGGAPKKDIELKNIPDYEALEYLIRSNSIDVYYSGFDLKEMPQISGKTQSVNLTNLVYVGINQKRGKLNDKNVRKALSLAVDRSDISEKCYYSLSSPALSIVNDGNEIIKNQTAIFNLEDNVPSSLEYLKKSGYKNLNKEGYYANSKNEIIELGLLYNSDNNVQSMVASNLVKHFKASGVKVTANGVSAAEYKSAVNGGNYDLYVAEIRLTKSFDYTKLLSYPKSVANDGFASSYQKYMQGEIQIEEMLEKFSELNPFIPLVFRRGTVSYSKRLSADLISSISDPYYNIEKLYLK